MKIKGFFKDIAGIMRIKKKRKEKIEQADGDVIPEDRISFLAKSYHPGKFSAVVDEIKQETNCAKRISFTSKQIPFFQAGNYLTIELDIDGAIVTRAYSIVSSPNKAYKEKNIAIIVKDYDQGFVSKYLNHNLKVGDEVILEVGLGEFNYQEYRDYKNIVAIAGGTGITPFISMAHDIIDRNLDINLTILYGSVNPHQIIAKDELDSLVQDNIKVVHIISGNYKFDGEKGFIDEKIIKKYSPKDCSYFVAGPEIMIKSVTQNLEKLGVDLRRIRVEQNPISDVTQLIDSPKDLNNRELEIDVYQGIYMSRIKANSNESIAVALERSGLRIHIGCRSGNCGFCRIKILEGKYYIPQEYDKRRYTDKEYDYVHACVTYPLSNLKIKINIS